MKRKNRFSGNNRKKINPKSIIGEMKQKEEKEDQIMVVSDSPDFLAEEELEKWLQPVAIFGLILFGLYIVVVVVINFLAALLGLLVIAFIVKFFWRLVFGRK